MSHRLTRVMFITATGRRWRGLVAALLGAFVVCLLLGGALSAGRAAAAPSDQPTAVTVKITAAEPNPAFVGDTVTITVVVSAVNPLAGVPTGLVEVKTGQNLVCQINLDALGHGQCALTFGNYGALPLKAIYAGADSFLPGVSDTVMLIVKTLEQSVLVYQNDFESAVGGEWCQTGRGTTPVGGRTFLGAFSNQTVCLSLVNLPQHAQINLAFDLFVISSWNGNQVEDQIVVGPDEWLVSADGVELLHTTFSNWLGHMQAYPGWFGQGSFAPFSGAEETLSLGYMTFNGQPADAVYHLEFTFPHSTSSLVVHFSAQGLQFLENESWGLDNVVVRTGVLDTPYRSFLPMVVR